MDDLSAKTVRNLFICILVFLPLQYAVVGIVGVISDEPWPAFVFPGFKNVYVYGNSYQINEFVVAVENPKKNSADEFTPKQFFYEIPNSQVAGFLRSNLDTATDIESFDNSTRQWFRARGDELLSMPAGDIYYIHRRRYLTRSESVMSTDSIVVVNRFKIAEGESK